MFTLQWFSNGLLIFQKQTVLLVLGLELRHDGCYPRDNDKLDSAPWPHSCWVHFLDAKRKVTVSAESLHEDPVLDTERTQVLYAITTTPRPYRNPLMSKGPRLPHQLKMLCSNSLLASTCNYTLGRLWNPALLSVPKLSHIRRQASLKFSWMRLMGSKMGTNNISQSKNQRWRQRQ